MSKKRRDEYLEDWHNVSNFTSMFEKNVLIFDGELRALHEAAKRMYDILEESYQRYLRHRSVEVNSSLAKYWSMKDLESRFPQVFHCFKFRGVEISITRFKNDFSVYIRGFTPPSDVSVVHIPWSSCYGKFSSLAEAFDLFAYCVSYYLDKEVRDGLF